MLRFRALAALALFCPLVTSTLPAQAPATGIYSASSFDNREFDSVNIGNLDVHFSIPIVSKPGRGMNFDYRIVYDGLMWSPSNNSGAPAWTPDVDWGFRGVSSSVVGYLTYRQATTNCPRPAGYSGVVPSSLQNNFVYHDPYGANHKFNWSIKSCPLTDVDPTITGDGSTKDGSGLRYDYGVIRTRSGSVINPAIPGSQNNGGITDSNGNSISNNGNGTFTDTLGTTALTVGGGGSESSPTTFAYNVIQQADSNTIVSVTMSYKTRPVETKFGCGIGEFVRTVNLPDRITLPDSTFYQFTYESTPGVSGAVTGRLTSVTLPTGGVINYTYSGGCNGSGMNSDGSVATLVRSTTDGSRTYARSITSPTSTTVVTDENQNQSSYWFVANADNQWYETERKVYQGPTSGTLLYDRITQYNGQSTPTQISGSILQTATFENYNGGTQLETDNVYDASGMLTSITQKSGSTTLQSVSNSYNALEKITSSTTRDISGNPSAYSYFGYDETAVTATSGIPQHGAPTGTRGNLTSSHVSAGAYYLNTTTTYYDTGVPIATVAPDGGTTQYAYDGTQTFATTTTLPTPSSGVALAATATYDSQSGAILTTTGMNSGQTAQITQYDRRLRPTIVTLPNGGQVTTTFDSANQTHVTQPMGNGQNAVTYTLLDSYGRKSRYAVSNGQSANGWYQIDYCYDAVGNLSFQSARYQSTGFSAPKQCSGSGTTYAYDALGRVTSATNTDGTTSTQYYGRAVKTTDVNGVQKITQYDLLGRISGVCEISSSGSMPGSGSPVACGMDITGTGFLTRYTYDPYNQVTITQGVQTRSAQTDPAGRMTSVTEPERGATSYAYSYNGTGLVVARQRPKANQTNASVMTTTTTQYDRLGRIVSINYDDGLTPAKSFSYDSSAGWAETQVNLKGMLSQISVTTPKGQAASIFSYDLMGWPSFDVSCTPSRCGASIADHGVPYTHDYLGNILTTGDAAGVNLTYTYSPASEVLSITSSQSDSTHPPNLVSAIQNGVNGPSGYSLGNGLKVANSYDSLGRLNGSWLCKNSSVALCTGGTQIYGVSATQIGARTVQSCDTVLNNCSNFGYDEFNRLTQQTVYQGTTQNFTYVYDRYGNRWQQNAPQGGPAPSYSFNTSNNQIVGFGYDAAGNMTNDGFHSYTYDAEGNILQIDGGSTATYAYDALNHRIREDVGTKGTEFVYNAEGQRVSFWNAANTALISGQVYWGSKPVSYRQSGEHFQHQDYLGTERLRTNWTGVVDSKFLSLPFGDNFSSSGSDLDQYHYAGLDRDPETSTQHAQFRQYSSTQGRWMSPDPYDGSYDPSDPQSLNRYSYVGNRPLSARDPLGLDWDFDPVSGCWVDWSTGFNSEGPTGTLGISSCNPILNPGYGSTGGGAGGGVSPGSDTGSGTGTDSGYSSTNARNSAFSAIQRIYNSGCVGNALKGNAASLSLDVLGVALAVSPFGPEAKIVGAIALGVTSTVVGGIDASSATAKGRLATLGAVANTFGIQTAPLELAQEFASFSKGAGKVLTGIGVGADLATVGVDIKTCLSQQR